MLSVEGLRKAFRAARKDVVAVNEVTFRVQPGELFTLLGPSGCGKTTTLRAIAGLERLDAGTVTLAGQVVADAAQGVHVSTDRRGLGMVFQSPTIWPHMTVRENVAFPLVAGRRAARPSRSEAGSRVAEALGLVRLDGLEDRPASDLSGGQQQRLALARALVCRPRLLLLDEPLSGLDEGLRLEVREELRSIHRDLGVTMLYVTHDQEEALALSTRIAVMKDGALEQLGTPREVYDRPATAFVAAFVGAANLLPGVVERRENGAGLVRTPHGVLPVPSEERFEPGARVFVVARPEHIGIAGGGASQILSETFLGDSVELRVATAGGELRVRVAPNEALEVGAGAQIRFESAYLTLVRDDNAP